LQKATGVRLHMLHLSTVGGVRMIRRAKADEQAVTADLNPFALLVTNSWDAVERLGPYCLGFWVPDEDSAALWEALIDGAADVIGTDHAPHTRAEEGHGWTDMFATPIVQHYLSLLLNEVNAGTVSLERVVDLCARRRAQLVGPYPRKGAIAAGADAVPACWTSTVSKPAARRTVFTNVAGRRLKIDGCKVSPS
jgi:dihydroorotase-like cyclic amidohydrolase